MVDRTPYLSIAASNLSTVDLEAHGKSWIHEGQYSMLSERTLANRRTCVEKIVWFLKERGFASCGPAELRAFLAYLVTSHDTPEGRWGNGANPCAHQAKKPMKASSVKAWHRDLRALFNYLVREEVIAASPLLKLPPPVARPDQIRPFSPEDIRALLLAAKSTRHALRDEAIILFLLDTGARASEACALKAGDIDFGGKCCQLQGKGGKVRTVYFGRSTARALWVYTRAREAEADEALFLSERGEGIARHGLRLLIHRLGEAAGIEQVRCSPHTCRHYFAVSFLRADGKLLELQQLMGHENLRVTQQYVALAQTDLAEAHRRSSPVDNLLRKRKA